MKEVSDLTQLQNKRCKNAAETALILLEVDRRKRLIEEIGGQEPSNDTLVSVLWMSMDTASRNHISGKLDVAEVLYPDLREALMKHTSLVGATSGSGGRSPTAMDVSAIATVTTDGEEKDEQPQQQSSQPLWSVNEAGWPVDEEG